MMRPFHFREFFTVVLAGAMCCPFLPGQQQDNPNAPPAAPKVPSTEPDKNCGWQATKGPTGPWKSTSTCPPSSPGAADTPSLTPEKSAQQKKAADAANPFPEAESRKAEDAADDANPAAKSTAPDYSSSYSSSRVDMKRLDESADRDSRISNGAGGYIHDPGLAAKDDKVGKFYLDNGDFKGAYDRYKEATEVAPEDGDAVFGLAESARGLRKTEEAANNYTLYLDAFPDGKKAKEARKALASLRPPKK
jgi:tetratricopeptide (TPR) repeat protein